jgi:uncharacterized protein (DUF362 family)
MNRRQFIFSAAGIAALSAVPRILKASAEMASANSDLVQVANGNPVDLVRTALRTLGGIERFIRRGDKVVVKPNIGWDRNPAQGANTHPEIVAEVVRQCLSAGASEVQVFDNPCNTASRCYDNSGIADAAKKAGAKVSFVLEKFFSKIELKNGHLLKKWEFYPPALEADKYINLPVLKQHSMATLTIGMKNIMGVIGGNRGEIHHNFEVKIVDLNTVIKPSLIIVDATRVIRRNGPVGGSLSDVDNMCQVIAGLDPVAVDAAAAELYGIEAIKIDYLVEAERRGLGSIKGLEHITRIDLNS